MRIKMNESLAWLEVKDSNYLIIHRHELKREIKGFEIKTKWKERKINKINKILEERGE